MERLSAIILIIFALCIIMGFIRGAVKMCFSLLTTILTLVIVVVATPYVSDAIIKHTQTDEWLRQNVEEQLENIVENSLGISLDLNEKEINSAQDYAKNDESKIIDGVFESLGVTKELENEWISSTALPDYIKNNLITNNNDEKYEEIGATNFFDYMGISVSRMVIRATSFLVTFILVKILFVVLFHALNIISKLPVLGGVNHLVGGFIGFFIALIVVWIIFAAITLLSGAGIGSELLETIQNTPILRFLYDMNVITKLAFENEIL